MPYAQAKSAKRLEEISAMSQQAAGGASATSPASWLRQYPSIAGLGAGSASTVSTAGAERSPPSLPLGARGPGAGSRAGTRAGAGAHGRSDMHSGASTQLLPSVAEDPQQLLENLRSEARHRCKGDRQRQELHMQMRLSEIQQQLQADREQLLEQLRSVEMQSTALQKAERLVRSANNRSDVAETLRMLSRAVEESEEDQVAAAVRGTAASSTAPSSAGQGHHHGHGHEHHRHGHGHRHGLGHGRGHPSQAPTLASNSGLHQGGQGVMLDFPPNGTRYGQTQDLV